MTNTPATTTDTPSEIVVADSPSATTTEVAAPPAPEPEPPPTPCMNCGTPLHGEYCSACGQRHEPHVHSVVEFAGEAFESVTHADSRLWNTLWLLMAKPGYLTREFLEGRRVRYLPPFRLYIVMSLLLFLVVAAVGGEPKVVEVNATQILQQGHVEATPPPAGETPEQTAQRICADVNIPGVTKQGCERALANNGDPLLQAMSRNIPRALFILLPLLALVMQAMYWRRNYVEHLLFFTHNHAFTFALYAVLIGIATFAPGWLVAICVLLMLFWPPLYTYRAMRRVFPQNRWITRAKFIVLACAYVFLIFLMAIATVTYSAFTL